MRYFYGILGILLLFAAFALLLLSKSAIHEILAAVTFLTSMVLSVGSSIMGTIERNHKEAMEQHKEREKRQEPSKWP